MKPRELRDRWREAQGMAAFVLLSWGRAESIDRHLRQLPPRGGVNNATPAEIAGLEWAPGGTDARWFNALRLRLLTALLRAGWPEPVIVEICHAKPEGIRQLARQLAGEPDPATAETLPGT